MRIAVPKEITPGEARVSLVPETIKRLVAKKLEVAVETGAGLGARVSDDEYKAAGAMIEPDAKTLYAKADVVIKVQVPTPAEILLAKEGSALVSLLYPLVNVNLVKALAERKVN